MLKALKECGGAALSVSDGQLESAAQRLADDEGIDACPEGGAALAALEQLVQDGTVGSTESVVLFNTGAGWLYR